MQPHRHDLVGTASDPGRREWQAWICSITPTGPAAIAMNEPEGTEVFDPSVVQVVAEAERQAAERLQHMDPSFSTRANAIEETSIDQAGPSNLQRMHTRFRTGISRRKNSVVCPFCAKDPCMSEQQQTRDWPQAKLAVHVSRSHLFNMMSSPALCPSCDESMPVKDLALHLDRQHHLGLSGKK